MRVGEAPICRMEWKMVQIEDLRMDLQFLESNSKGHGMANEEDGDGVEE